MASNLEKLRAKKNQNKTSEASVSASYSIDAISDINDNVDSNDSIDIIDSKPAKQNPASKPKKTTKPDSSAKTSTKMVSTKDITIIDDSNDIKEKSLGLRLASDDDKRYLDLAPLGRSMTKKAFFIELIQKELKNNSSIDLYDPLIEEFRNSSLKTTAITIAVPETLITVIKELAAKHMMKYQRYIAYVVYKARTSDPNWT